MPKFVELKDVSTLLWFPDDPNFGQWLTKKVYQYSIPSELEIENTHILINWSNRVNVYGFEIARSPVEPKMFHTSEPFKYLKGSMDGIAMKAGHLMIDRAEDVVMFRILYGDQF